MCDERLPDIPPACPAGRYKTLITIPLAADAVNFSARHCRRQFRCSAAPAGPGFAGTVFAGLPKLRRVNAMQTKPRIADLERIAIDGSRFALQQHGVHALGFSRRRSNANSKQRKSE